MRNFVVSSVAAGLIGGAMMISGAAPVSALTLPSPAVAATGETGTVELVQYSKRQARQEKRERRYDRNRHGKRYSQRRPGYNHRYGNYYYSSPWWIGPSIGFALTVPGYGGGYGYGYGGGGHVEWCLNRFRSYDPASDTYLGYDGYRHRCNSPFG